MNNIVTDAGNGNTKLPPAIAGLPQNPIAILAIRGLRNCLLDRQGGWPKVIRDIRRAERHVTPAENRFLSQLDELRAAGRPIPSADVARFEALARRITLGRLGGVQ